MEIPKYIRVQYEDGNQTILCTPKDPRRAVDFKDDKAKLTDRQFNFYVNLMKMAQCLKSNRLPLNFTANGKEFYMDRGCVKIAQHAGFIRPLVDAESGYVEWVELNWNAEG